MSYFKLQSELEFVESRMLSFSKEHDVQSYVNEVRKTKDYNNLEVRIAWDILRASVGTKVICSWYDKYGCNDTNITTLAKRAIKVLHLDI